MTTTLRLTCPQCHKRAQYKGYPADPVLSTTYCLMCGYVGLGATFQHHHKKGERCIQDVDFSKVKVSR